MPEDRPRRRRRAVGPAGAPAGEEPRLDLEAPAEAPPDRDRFERERPPHHDRGL
ncbi:MAG TPA: hypothetical protein VNU66_05030 [Mycobacteriales bacterium]|nr:hypothetical protein [Mycobacteriales bacterium]